MRLERRLAGTRVRVWTLSVSTLMAFCLLPTGAHAETTALFFDSQPGDYIGGGLQNTYLPGAGATFTATVYSDNTIDVRVAGPSFSYWWDLNFRGASAERLQAVHYYDVGPYPWTKGVSMSVGGSGRGCDGTGRFWVRELVVSGSAVQKLAIDFEQHCDGYNPGLFGALRINSDVDSLIPFDGDYPRYRLDITPTSNGAVTGTNLDCRGPGPSCSVEYADPQSALVIAAEPDTGFYFSGWSGTCHGGLHSTLRLNTITKCGALFTPVDGVAPRVLMLNSLPGDYIGKGKRHILNDANAFWRDQVTIFNGTQNLSIAAEELGGDANNTSLNITINGPSGTPLVPGTFPMGGRPSLRMSADSSGCNQTTGTLTIHEAQITGSTVTKLAVDFEQYCDGLPAPLLGSLRINSTVPPRPSLGLLVSTGGRVELTPSGQNCTTNCYPTFAPGAVVTMTPIPAVGYAFAGWQGDAECAGGTVTMVAPITCQAQFVNQLSADLMTPASGVGTSQTFTLEYSSTLGGDDITTAWVWFTPTFSDSSANSCLLYYQQGGGSPRFFLLNDAGTTWQSALAGSAGTLQNSRCAIDTLASGATVSGNTLRVTLKMSFLAAGSGYKRIFMYAANAAGGNSQWKEKGSYVVPSPAVSAFAPSPNAGSGARQTFTLSYAYSYGGDAITQGWVWFTASFTGGSANSCLAYYERTTNRLALLNDAGTTWSFATIGSATPLQNSRCALSPSTATASVSGNNLTVTLTVTFFAPYVGTKQMYTYATNGTQSSGWSYGGTWTVQAPLITSGAPTPASGTGMTQLFSLPYISNLGAGDVTRAWVWFNSTLAASAAASCLVHYEQPTNMLFLLSDDGTTWLPAPMGTTATLQNGQCSIAVNSSSVGLSGDVLTLQLAMTFTPAFAGAKNIYMYSEGSGVSGWLDRGDWSVPAPPSPVTVDAVSPGGGSAASQTFVLTYSSTSGAPSLTSTWVWFNATFAQTAAASCLAYYEPPSGLVYLLDDSGTGWQAAALGAVATLQNSQCAINLTGSQAMSGGDTLTLSLDVTFTPAFAGDKNIFLYASAGGVNSGWQDRGDWTVPRVVTTVGVTPNSGSNASAMFALAYASVNGASDLTTTWVWFNATFAETAAASCLVYYDQPANALFLLDDTGTTWHSAIAGSGGTLQNSQCSIDVSAVSIISNGDTLTVNLPVTFGSPAFNGTKRIYMYAANAQAASGWQDRGYWTVP